MFVFVMHMLLLYQLDLIVSQTDPCNSNNHKRLEEAKRSAGYSLDRDNFEIAISDDRLDPGWYRIISDAGTEMPNKAPGTFRCKTWYPIWLNGTLPTELDQQISQQACIQTFTSECGRTWSIDIKKCTGNFLVYNLAGSTLAKSAYCFGTEVKCPDGQYSETGYSPGCKIYPCHIYPCENNGTCRVDVNGNATCICEENWNGPYCQVSPCDSLSCLNGGSCRVEAGIAACFCKGDYSGTTCEVSPCSHNPCLNDGSCTVDLNAKLVCTCNGEWTGFDCSISPCVNNPCKNNGTCSVDVNGNATCTCDGNWNGTYCQVSPCNSLSCLNDGSCRVEDGVAACVCKGDFSGPICEVSPCSPNPCTNDGSCSVDVNYEATCVCNREWTGRYCSIPAKCPDGQHSETGYYPGCTIIIPQEVFSPLVIAELAEGIILSAPLGPRLEAVFRCSFADVDSQTYSYDVYWYINEQSVVTHNRIAYSNINQTLLRPTDWVGQYQMNMVVKCAVRARFDASSVPGPYYHSSLFEAGVKPEKNVYKVLEGDDIVIPITTSVPVECVGSSAVIRQRCTQTIQIAQPEYQGNPSDKCVNNIQEESMVFKTQYCGVTFSTYNWDMPVNLTVTGYVDNIYNTDDRTAHIRLKTENGSSTGLSGVWDTVNIPDIQIVVLDRDSAVTSRLCETWNNPQYRTTDGKTFTYQGCGEYILYRHKRYPYRVHTLTTKCSTGVCICGIAIRSHDSLFVVRTCDVISTELYVSGRHYPSMAYSVCDNKHMVIEKITGTQFKVTLPIGTIIIFRIDGSFITPISIKPSALDIEQTEGLCGYISKTKDMSDDFMPRGSNSFTSLIDFARSWRVKRNSDEELFSPKPTFPTEDLSLKEYCLCVDVADQNDDIANFNNVHCNLTEPMVQCKNTRTPLATNLYQECHKNRRRKRAVDSDDVFEDTPLTYDSNYDPDYLPPEPEWKNGWTEDSARQACTDGLSQMTALEICQTYAHIGLSSYIEPCIDDIKNAGSTEFIKYTIWLMEDACRLEVSKNESLFRSNSSSGGPSVLDKLQNQLCPSNCSNNGYCNMSVCVCDTGFIGFDCSVTLSEPPTELTIPNKGLCSTKTRLCKKTNIFSIFYSEKVYCKFQHFTASENGKQLISGRGAMVKEAVYRYENMVSCDIPTSQKRRSTDNSVDGYDLSLSYDGINYGDSVSFIIYDEDCFTCNAATFTCVRLDTCDTTTVPPNPITGNLWRVILGAVAGSCALIVIMVTICIVMKNRSNNDSNKENPSPSHSC